MAPCPLPLGSATVHSENEVIVGLEVDDCDCQLLHATLPDTEHIQSTSLLATMCQEQNVSIYYISSEVNDLLDRLLQNAVHHDKRSAFCVVSVLPGKAETQWVSGLAQLAATLVRSTKLLYWDGWPYRGSTPGVRNLSQSKQPPRTTQPGHPSVGRHKKLRHVQWKRQNTRVVVIFS